MNSALCAHICKPPFAHPCMCKTSFSPRSHPSKLVLAFPIHRWENGEAPGDQSLSQGHAFSMWQSHQAITSRCVPPSSHKHHNCGNQSRLRCVVLALSAGHCFRCTVNNGSVLPQTFGGECWRYPRITDGDTEAWEVNPLVQHVDTTGERPSACSPALCPPASPVQRREAGKGRWCPLPYSSHGYFSDCSYLKIPNEHVFTETCQTTPRGINSEHLPPYSTSASIHCDVWEPGGNACY